jgi:hypothetical protein
MTVVLGKQDEAIEHWQRALDPSAAVAALRLPIGVEQ